MDAGLIVGINKYQSSGNNLRGCVNDMGTWHRMFNEEYGIDDKDIVLLKNKQATTSAMRAALVDGIRSLKSGDTFRFAYSGHGSYVFDDNGDETDRKDEVLCPCDFGVVAGNHISDDFFATLLDQIHDGAFVEMFLDCCHSGTMDRAWFGERAKNIANDRFIAFDLSKSKRRTRKATVNTGRYRIWSGCGEHQTSADAFIGLKYQGAFTAAFAATVAERGLPVRLNMFVRFVRKWLGYRGYSQRPEVAVG